MSYAFCKISFLFGAPQVEMIQQSDLRSIVAQIIKLDEFAVDEGKLWARLVEWSAAAVRKPEQLGPYADAVGEGVKRIKTDADDGCSIHEMEQQMAILQQMSQQIRFGAMNKDFFVDKARKYLTREESEEILVFFVLGRQPQRLMVSPRTGLVLQGIKSFPITVKEVRELLGDMLGVSLGATASLSTTLAQGNGNWTPRFNGMGALTKLQVKVHQRVWISSVRLTLSSHGAMWPITVKPPCTTVTTGRIVDCKLVSAFWGDTLEIAPHPADNPAPLTKIEVFGPFLGTFSY